MPRLLPFVLLFLPAVLLTTTSCHREAPAPAAPVANGRYRLDTLPLSSGQTTTRSVTGEARAILSSDPGYDYVEVHVVAVPQPATGAADLTVSFSKRRGQPTTAYAVDNIRLDDHDQLKGVSFQAVTGTLVSTGNGGVSGTFSGRYTSLSGFVQQVDYTLADGVFTDARP